MLRKMTSNAGMVQIPFPEPISLIYNPLENIRYFQEQWKYYCVAAGLDKSPEEKKIAILYLLIGREAFLFITNNLMLTDEEQRTSDGILQALENNFKPKVNVVYERFIFNQAVQDENENIDSFVNKLKKLASKCDFKEKFEEMIRDRFLVGLRNLLVQKELLADSELTLQKAITLTKNKEQNTNELQTLYYKIGTNRQLLSSYMEVCDAEPKLKIKLEKIDHVHVERRPSLEIDEISVIESVRSNTPEKRLKMDTNEYNKKDADISVIDANKIISSVDYNIGSFVVLKEDYDNGGDPPIWKIDSNSLLQKFVPFEEDGLTLYKNTAVYSGWSLTARTKYYRISVINKSKSYNRKDLIVQFRKDLVIRENQTEESAILEKKNGGLKKR